MGAAAVKKKRKKSKVYPHIDKPIQNVNHSGHKDMRAGEYNRARDHLQICRGVNCLAIQTVAMAVGIVKLQLSDSDGKDTRWTEFYF